MSLELYSNNPLDPRYDTLRGLLDDTFGSNDPSSGAFTETGAIYHEVIGQGPQEIDFTFLYDGGGYSFEFGFFHLTDELLAMETTTVEQKQAWATQALSTAEIVVVDRNASSVPSGAIKATAAASNPYSNNSWEYVGEKSSANTSTLMVEGGSRLGFFIIPDNTLSNFLADSSDGNFSQFAVNGSLAQYDGKNWPLFSYTPANPGLEDGNTGADAADGNILGTTPDQVLTFNGETEEGWFGPGSESSTGTLVSFEDLWRRPNPGSSWWNSSDSDFEDLVFYIGNVNSPTPVPEPGTMIAGVFCILIAGIHFVRIHRRKNKC